MKVVLTTLEERPPACPQPAPRPIAMAMAASARRLECARLSILERKKRTSSSAHERARKGAAAVRVHSHGAIPRSALGGRSPARI